MTSTEEPELIVQPGAPAPGSLMIRVSPDMVEDLEAELRAAGIEPGHAAEFASGPEMVLLTVQISAVGGSLAAVLRTVFHRNDGKRLRLDTDTGRGGRGLLGERVGARAGGCCQILGAARSRLGTRDRTG